MIPFHKGESRPEASGEVVSPWAYEQCQNWELKLDLQAPGPWLNHETILLLFAFGSDGDTCAQCYSSLLITAPAPPPSKSQLLCGFLNEREGPGEGKWAVIAVSLQQALSPCMLFAMFWYQKQQRSPKHSTSYVRRSASFIAQASKFNGITYNVQD